MEKLEDTRKTGMTDKEIAEELSEILGLSGYETLVINVKEVSAEEGTG